MRKPSGFPFDLDNPFSQLPSTLLAHQYSSVAALTLLCWEYFLTCSQEYHHIWSFPFNQVKGAYLFARYYGILSQVVNVYLFLNFRVPVQMHACRSWHTFLFVSSASLQAILDYILILRVYALCNQSKRVGAYLMILFLTQASLTIAHGKQGSQEIFFDEACNWVRAPVEVIYLTAIICVLHISLWYLSITRLNNGPIHPLLRLVIRDGSIVLVTICAIVLCATPFAFLTKEAIPSMPLLIWPHTFFSVVTCRIIMNMQSLRIDEPVRSAHRSNFILTSFFNMSQRESGLDEYDCAPSSSSGSLPRIPNA
ncbi:uncharacterized protein LACBIDRAFT_312258 [Laccaria bicolor S238N-H82]|uniref:Predicted protein n=1 Tax=Laccaria bicolor (strain S238N-H82 / ATCC MYA-4686) TaxID=486041 RepID=B0DVU1_LACBS|nr:uncharacterized protein LACBIDRAFT_312258 [Laccaria bicolor S238N-H82]EDR01313.1 predicted protein [Laccaria bicolor S238N-H82]|eukprot:XP_001888020.1 predicted protein [Laccaria bicolor S238N-H82]